MHTYSYIANKRRIVLSTSLSLSLLRTYIHTGSDTLSGGKGGDTLKGGQGSDTIKICVDDVILGNSTDVGIICKALLTPPSPPSPPPPSTCDGFCGGQSAASCYCDLAYVDVKRERESSGAVAVVIAIAMTV